MGKDNLQRVENKVILLWLYDRLRVFVNITLLIFGILCSGQVLAEKKIKILMFGNSLTAGYGLNREDAIPFRLQKTLNKSKTLVSVINGGVSGDTSAGGKSRLDWSLDVNPDIIVIELGANDGLRGLRPSSTMANLDFILRESKRRGIKILLTGMKAPPNLGHQYGKAFEEIFPKLAKKYEVLFYPFFLEGVAAIASLNQADGIHPNKKGVNVIVKKLIPFLRRLMARGKK